MAGQSWGRAWEAKREDMMGTHELVIAIISVLCGAFCGANIGIFVMALMVAASKKPLMTKEDGDKAISRLDKQEIKEDLHV